MVLLKQEIKYILYAIGFSLIWFLFAIPKLLELGIEDSSPYMQFLVFNIGLFLFLQLFLKAKAMDSRIINMRRLSGALGVIALFMAIDIMVPPFLVNQSGELLNSVVLKASGTDYVVGYFATNLGLTGIYIYLFTYILIPALLLLVAAQLLPNFVREL